MTLVENFNIVVEREVGKLTQDQEASMEASMTKFDELIRVGAVQPERYRIEPISTVAYQGLRGQAW